MCELSKWYVFTTILLDKIGCPQLLFPGRTPSPGWKLSTFYLISWPKMETKTCLFGTTLGLATRSTWVVLAPDENLISIFMC